MTPSHDILITARQLEFLALVASGYDFQQIGEMKHLSPLTIRNVLYTARDRVGAKNVTHLAVLCVDRGLIRRNGVGYVPVVDDRVIE